MGDLQTKIKKLDVEITENLKERKALDKRINTIRADIASLQKEVDKLKTANVIVTEHAMLRYLERVQGIDMEEVKRAILPENSRKIIAQLGPGTYPVNGFKIKVADRSVVTVISNLESESA
jgi:chromosome segregation ATPase